MLTKIRQTLLLPSPTQWRKASLPSKQTTAAWIGCIAGLVIAIYALYPSSQAERDAARKAIENVVAVRAAEVRAIAEIDINFHPSVDFTSQNKVIAESERFNDYARKTFETLNVSEVDHLFKRYGSEQQRSDLYSHMNRIHDTTAAVTSFLETLARSNGPASQEDLSRLARQYLSLLNDVKAAQSSMNGFVVGLTGKYFGY